VFTDPSARPQVANSSQTRAPAEDLGQSAPTSDRPAIRPRPRRLIRLAQAPGRRASRVLAGAAIVAVTVLAGPGVAHAAADGPPVILAADSLEQVVNNLRNWLMAILAALATLFLTIGAVRYLAANGDPSEVEKGKTALKSAAIGYALALLAPLLISVVRGLVG